MSDDEVVASYVPPRYLFNVYWTPDNTDIGWTLDNKKASLSIFSIFSIVKTTWEKTFFAIENCL